MTNYKVNDIVETNVPLNLISSGEMLEYLFYENLENFPKKIKAKHKVFLKDIDEKQLKDDLIEKYLYIYRLSLVLYKFGLNIGKSKKTKNIIMSCIFNLLTINTYWKVDADKKNNLFFVKNVSGFENDDKFEFSTKYFEEYFMEKNPNAVLINVNIDPYYEQLKKELKNFEI